MFYIFTYFICFRCYYMLIHNKFFINSAFFLFNEKVCYRLDRSKFNPTLFIRFDLRIVCYSDLNLIYFCFLSLPIISKSIRLLRNNIRSFILCRFFPRVLYKALPFVFFSILHYYIDSRFSYFWYSRYNNVFTNSVLLYANSKLVSHFGYFDAYFYGLLDANYLYQINFSMHNYFNFSNSVFLRLFYSLLSIPFVNKRAKK